MKIQIIDIDTNLLLDELDYNDILHLPRIDEIVAISSGPYIVKGIAHMWNDAIIKILVLNAAQK